MRQLETRTSTLALEELPARILVPAVVYGRPGGSFRIEADRASHLVVLAQTRRAWVGLHSREAELLGFDQRRPYLVVEGAGEADVLHGPPGPQGFDAILRAVYERDRRGSPLRPWMTPDRAARLAARGLLHWHYRREEAVLYETVAFAPPHQARERMHVAWLSGTPTAYALLAHGRTTGDSRAAAAGAAVLDTVARGVAPCGAFWGQWTPDGWRAGWNGRAERLQARTAAEATLFLLRATRMERREAWVAAVSSNLEFALRSQSDDGDFAAYFEAQTGTADGRDGAAGLAWIPALVEAGNRRYLQAAVRAGSYYERFLLDGVIHGAPEDVTDAPTSEDGYNALMAYVSLFDATRAPKWLELARRAAEWMFTFRWAHNLAFPAGSVLAENDFRTRGADLASPTNQHLHAYGLICLPELMRLWRYTGDAYYLDRARDNLACFLQLVARKDGDFGAQEGMVSERYFNTACYGEKGGLLPVSHAWCAGLLLYACTQARAWADALAL